MLTKAVTRRKFLGATGAFLFGSIFQGCPLRRDYYLEEKDGVVIEHNLRYAPALEGEGSFFSSKDAFNFEEENKGFIEQVENLFSKVPRKLDAYYPALGKRKGAVMMIHGGAWVSGCKVGKSWPDYAYSLSKNGFVSFVLDYRLAPVDKWPSMIDDCQLALDWINENSEYFDFDKRNIAVMGSSSGGHLTALLSTIPGNFEKMKIGIPLYGVYDLVESFGHRGEGSFLNEVLENKKKIVERAERGIFGTTYDESPEVFEWASPLSRIYFQEEEEYPQIRVIHGLEDKLVNFSQAKRFYEEMSREGKNCELISFEGGHGFPQNYVEDNWGKLVLGIEDCFGY